MKITYFALTFSVVRASIMYGGPAIEQRDKLLSNDESDSKHRTSPESKPNNVRLRYLTSFGDENLTTRSDHCTTGCKSEQSELPSEGGVAKFDRSTRNTMGSRFRVLSRSAKYYQRRMGECSLYSHLGERRAYTCNFLDPTSCILANLEHRV